MGGRYSNCSDDEILHDLANGEENEVYRCLYNEVFPLVERYIQSKGGNFAESCDIFQESVIDLRDSLARGKFQVKEDNSVRKYLFTIAKNKWFKKLRNQKKDNPWARRFTDEVEKDIIDEMRKDEKQLEDNRIVSQCLEEMGDPCKELILLSFADENLGQKEIARLMNYASAGVVKTIKNRCMTKLRVCFDKKIKLRTNGKY